MIRILMFEKNVSFSEKVSDLFNGVDDYKVVSSLRTLVSLQYDIVNYQPHVVLMDADFAADDIIASLRAIKKINSKTKVIILAETVTNEIVVECIRAGADGYVFKSSSNSKFIEYVQEALAGGAPMSPSIARYVIQTFSEMDCISPNSESLTTRERDVLRLLVRGSSYKLVAFDLNIAIDTVRTHIKKIYDKLEVNSKSEAVAKAIRNNLV